MKKAFAAPLALATILSSAAALAQHHNMDDMKGMDMGAKPAAATHHASGVVKSVDAGAGVVTLAHDPVKTLNWPAMTMKFQVKDKALLDKLAVGKTVDFDFEQSGKGYVVTSVK
jgi:Cu(I)/Ag(I) efflux system protein CusF